jgi:hypothetical protein
MVVTSIYLCKVVLKVSNPQGQRLLILNSSILILSIQNIVIGLMIWLKNLLIEQ